MTSANATATRPGDTSATPEYAYWRSTRRVTAVLLLIWCLATAATCLYADELNAIVIAGFPLGFYMAAQGVLLVYLAIVGFYAWFMDRLEVRARQARAGRKNGADASAGQAHLPH